jgi:hypothetical protein
MFRVKHFDAKPDAYASGDEVHRAYGDRNSID